MLNLGHDLADAAATSGAGPLRRLLLIDLPLMKSSLGGAAALIVVLASHEFSASVLVRSVQTQVMGTVLYDLFAFGSYPQTAVMALLTCVVTGAGVLFALRLGGRGAFERADA
jgi:iron(III) transport system permease protein